MMGPRKGKEGDVSIRGDERNQPLVALHIQVSGAPLRRRAEDDRHDAQHERLSQRPHQEQRLPVGTHEL